ncbi:MAG: hypothetical protein M1308_11150 [Actinobacteria bacterium]|nr:hypothetical protein [Actinomycetota bacterium]
MSVITVQGLKDENDLGMISPHEHIFIDIRNQADVSTETSNAALSEIKVSITNLDILSRNPYAIRDNLVLNDIYLAEEELSYFKEMGGNTIVDATPKDIGRDPSALYKISQSLDLNIIAGTGYYTQDTHCEEVDILSVEEISLKIEKDILEGMDDTHIRAGVIGEIGLSRGILNNEMKVLKASGMVQKKTGAGILVHTYPWSRDGIKAIKILEKTKCNVKKICICHIDIDIDLEYCTKLCSRGVYIEFDNFGKEYYLSKRDAGFAGGAFARDIERVRTIKVLIEKGFINNILISNDICLKTLLHRYGGWGYDHIITNIQPMMLDEGISPEEINLMFKENPKNFLNIK